VRKGRVRGVGTDVEVGNRVEVVFAEGLESGFILGLLADVGLVSVLGLASALGLDTAETEGLASALGLDTAETEGLASAIGLDAGVELAFELGSLL